jgi:hypothetical protein
MSIDAYTDTDTLLAAVLGPDFEYHLIRDFTDAELADIDEALAVHGGDVAAALGVNVDADTAAILQSLPIGSWR